VPTNAANSMRYRPLAYLSACGAPRGARRDPKRIADTHRFALFGAPSPSARNISRMLVASRQRGCMPASR
jgi:hypothetical protein